MGKVFMEISMSVDGYVTGPDVSPEAPLGRGGERLHDWMFTGKSAGESEQCETEHFSTIGALILGRRMADLGIGPWGEGPTVHAPDLRGRAYGSPPRSQGPRQLAEYDANPPLRSSTAVARVLSRAHGEAAPATRRALLW